VGAVPGVPVVVLPGVPVVLVPDPQSASRQTPTPRPPPELVVPVLVVVPQSVPSAHTPPPLPPVPVLVPVPVEPPGRIVADLLLHARGQVLVQARQGLLFVVLVAEIALQNTKALLGVGGAGRFAPKGDVTCPQHLLERLEKGRTGEAERLRQDGPFLL